MPPHPFDQSPTYEEGDLALFETGGIVLHIAERHAGLLPDDANARGRSLTWMIAKPLPVEGGRLSGRERNRRRRQ